MTETTNELTCSIVIRAYNEEQRIRQLLDGISQQTIKKLEVILVDSGSTDNTLHIVNEFKPTFPLSIVHIQPNEFTFGRSLNLGLSHTHGDLIVIASAHVYPVYPDWLESLLAPFADQKIALSYGKQRGDKTSLFSEQRVFEQWYPEKTIHRQEHPFCNNANAAIRRSLWESHHYDETLSGLEDIAWANWAIKKGFFLSYVAEAEVVHIHNETPQAVYNRYRREGMAFKHIFPNEHFGLWNLLRLFTTNVYHDIRHALDDHTLTESLNSIFWFRWMQFWGTYQGYRHTGPLTWHLKKTFYYPQSSPKTKNTLIRNIEPIRYNE